MVTFFMLPFISVTYLILLDILSKGVEVKKSLNELESFLDITVELMESNIIDVDAILILNALKILYLFVQAIDNLLIFFN